MKRTLSFSCFLLILIASPLAATGNLQNAFALTPVADLTGDWSGFAQVTITEGYCEFTGKVNAHLTQNENNIVGSYTFVPTSSKSIDPEIYHCELESWSDNLRGTIDGSRITLYSSDATLTGSYTSSGISLSVASPDYYGSTKLSPTGFTPPPFEPKEKKDTDADGIPDEKDQCLNLKEDYFGKNDADGCPEKDSDNDGFYDYEDRCPYDPEDFIGIEDGCPEVEKDSDGDGVLDSDDLCLYEQEDYLGVIDGCLEYFDEEEFTEDEFAEDEELEDVELEAALDEWISEPQPEDWVEGETPQLLRDTDDAEESTYVFPPRLPDNFFRTNGCGSQEAGIDLVPDFDFAESCNQHDICYARGGNAADRKTCDEEFYDSIKSNSKLGKFGATIYYWAVRLGGTSSFNCEAGSCR